MAAIPRVSVQGGLTEETFSAYLEGYEPVVPQDLLDAKGGSIRYAIDTKGGPTQYRLGGLLTMVDPDLRYLRLLNPNAIDTRNPTPARHKGVGWSVQLKRPPNERIRIWYMPNASRDEVVMFRKLLQQLETGEITITKRGA